MGGGGNPHGQSVGLMNCTGKTDEGKKVFLSFSGDSGSASFTVSKEVAEYFTVGATYEVSFTTP
jgi:hypothetical protein